MKLVLAGPLSELQETARHIADVSNECKLQVNKDEYVESFQPNLMDVVHSWSKVKPCPPPMSRPDLSPGPHLPPAK